MAGSRDRSRRLARFLVPPGAARARVHVAPWTRVLWLTGVDYFSTLGYQPGIAFLAAGALSPIATVILVAVTVFCALPVYREVAARSFAGQGSIAMLERLLSGWTGKLAVLALLGFAATDFVITMTLSAADATQHLIENPFFHDTLSGHRVAVTSGLLVLLAGVFLAGFREAISLAGLIAVPYLALNAVVIGRAGWELAAHPALLTNWRADVAGHGDMVGILFASVLVFPRLALGLSGFETGVSVMPLVRGDAGDGPAAAGRIRGTRRLLAVAAGIMSVYLIGSSLVTTTLIPAGEFAPSGRANGRALAFLAHTYLGGSAGTIYDVVTIAILWFAGASAMAGMLNLIPRYLPRFGMAPSWAEHPRPVVLALLAVNLVVTVAFDADVDAQGGAYATGVLALMLSAAVAVALTLWREARAAGDGRARIRAAYFWMVAAVFAFTLVDNVIGRPDGLIIASLFIGAIVLVSAVSRWMRAQEIRVERHAFTDAGSEAIWRGMAGKKVNLVPVASMDLGRLTAKATRLRRHDRAHGPLAFVHVDLADDRSEFRSSIRVRVHRRGAFRIIQVTGASAVANAIAWISEELDPVAIYLELTLDHPFSQAVKFLLWGEGETGLLVYAVLTRHWRATPEVDIRPRIFLLSR